MIFRKAYFTIICILFLLTNSYANHILGGEIVMTALDEKGNFEIKLLQFWNKKNLIVPTKTIGGNRDVDADLYIYSKKTNKLVGEVSVKYISTENIEYKNYACATYKSMETVLGIYNGTVYLDPQVYNEADGYYIVWERCCRNEDITNIKQPGESGMVFYLEFPPISVKNSSPEFTIPNGEYICVNKDFVMSMSAIDKDGDELRFSLETPLKGYTDQKFTKGDKSSKKGYPMVNWEIGYGKDNAIKGNIPLKINESNGQLSVNASILGLYVFTITCKEFRNGRQIGLVRRDFQLLVIDCADEAPAFPQILTNQMDIKNLKLCLSDTIKIATEDQANWAYQWQRNGKNIPGATGASLMVTDTGFFQVNKSFSNKCGRDTLSAPVRVDYKDPIKVSLFSQNNILCNTDSIIIIDKNVDVNIPKMNTWYLDNVVITQELESTIFANKPGTYKLVSKNINSNCYGKDSVLIYKDKLVIILPAQSKLQKGSSMVLSPKISDINLIDSFSWQVNGQTIDNSNWNLMVSPSEDTVYKLLVVSKNGCLFQYLTNIKLFNHAYIPTAFTPNGDGINDYFEIKIEKEEIIDVKIFNRWGKMVFFSKGYDQSWNGMFGDSYLENGYYPYTITLIDNQKLQGQILIIR